MIRAKLLVMKHGRVYAVCKGCRQEVLLPLEKSDFGPPLYLEK